MRRFLGVLAALLILVALAGAGWWLWLADRAERMVTAFVEERRATGELVEYAAIRKEGFPLAVRLRVEKPKLARSGAGWHWEWTGDELLAEAPVWAPARVHFRGEGTQILSGTIGRNPRPLRLEVSGVNGDLGREAGRWILRAHGYDARLTEQGRPEHAVTAAAANLLIGYPQPTGRLRLAVDMDTIRLPEAGLLGDTIAYLDADVEADVPLPKDESAAALAAWRDAGGRFDLARLTVNYGPAEASASGMMALDPQLRPAGQIDAKVQGWEAIVDALVKQGQIPERSAAAAKMFLGVMAKPAGTDGKPAIEARLTAGDGQLRLGPFTIMQLGPLAR